MSKVLWRVVWNLRGTKGPKHMSEFTAEGKAMEWAEGLFNGGANGIVVTEMIVGNSFRIDGQSYLPN